MQPKINRRGFVQKSVLASSAAALAFGFEEQALLAKAETKAAAPPRGKAVPGLPSGHIGKVSISRLICGGNLISGFAHSRDLIYVSELLKHYFTDAKVCDTLRLCEEQGINTAILRVDDDTLRILRGYRKDLGGKIQWIAQAKILPNDIGIEIQQAIDHGAVGAYVHGGVGDELVQKGGVDLLGKAVELIQKNGLIAGIAGHSLAVPMACEKAGLKPDFYMKTFNSKNYWSAGPKERHDSVWEETPQETMAFMQEVERPWIAYKVLGAGAIHPDQGFQYAFENGADFICVGMFDFQIADDVRIATNSIAKARYRTRSWSA
jgi:hypothetical protein